MTNSPVEMDREKLVFEIIKHAPVSDALLESVRPALERQSLSELQALMGRITAGHRAAQHSYERSVALADMPRQDLRTSHKIAGELSKRVFGSSASHARAGKSLHNAIAVSRKLDRILEEVFSEVIKKIQAPAKDDRRSGFIEQFSFGNILPLTIGEGVASATDLHRAFATVEYFTNMAEPDFVVGLNKGGNIVCRYLRSRLVSSSWPVEAKLRDQKWLKHDRISAIGANISKDRTSRESIRSIAVYDDISRTGETIDIIKDKLNERFPGAKLYVITMIASDKAIERSFDRNDFSVFVTDEPKVRLPYNSHGTFLKYRGVNIFGSSSCDMSFTDHEVNLFLKEVTNHFGKTINDLQNIR